MSLALCFGGAVMDFVRGPDDRWQARAGGSAWTVARALSALGQPAAFAGALGDDPFAAELVSAAAAHGVELRYAVRVAAPTALSVVHRSDPAHYTFYAHGAADSLFPGVDPAAWTGARAAYFGGVTLVRDPARSAFLDAATEARARGLTVVYDPNYRPQHAAAYRAVFAHYAALADLIKVSEEDLAGLLPHLSPQDAAAHLQALNPAATVLLTRGAAGARLLGPRGHAEHPGYRVTVADTVGAGDASIAALLYCHLHWPDWPPAEQLAFALACAGAACTRLGAHAPTLADIEAVQKETP